MNQPPEINMSPETSRQATINRKTNETDIALSLYIDGNGKTAINSGVPFLDHMLTLFAVHGFFDLSLEADGDLEIDAHHTVEDIGICLGQAFHDALAGFKGINRYGQCSLPMDETLAKVTVDLSNRPYLHFDIVPLDPKVGDFDTALCLEFLRALVNHGGMTLHVEVSYGHNTHHILEAIFKGLGRCLDQASTINPRVAQTLSSKGML